MLIGEASVDEDKVCVVQLGCFGEGDSVRNAIRVELTWHVRTGLTNDTDDRVGRLHSMSTGFLRNTVCKENAYTNRGGSIANNLGNGSIILCNVCGCGSECGLSSRGKFFSIW